MATFCIPRQFIDILQKSALKNKVQLAELYEMNSSERRSYFEGFTDKPTAQFLNTKFEQAIVSKQKEAVLDWAKSIFTPTEKGKATYKTVLDKINQLDELGILSDKAENVFLEDLVTDKLGISATPEEMRQIVDKANKVEEAQKKLGTDMGNPEKFKENVDYFMALKEVNDYMQSITPANDLAILTGVVGRGMMLASVKSPVLNIGSNIEMGLVESIGKRLASGQVRGADNKLALEYMKMAREIYAKTGFDISRMMGIRDFGASGERVLGDTIHTKGTSAISKAGSIVEEIVFKNLMGAPDAAFASAHFVDSVNIYALKEAKGDKVRAREFMIEAMKIDQSTVSPEAKIIRAQAILDAQTATYTNESWASKMAEGTRRIFNDLSPNLRVGDYLFPFVKTPANVVASGMDYAGLGALKSLVAGIDMYRSGDTGNIQKRQYIIRNAIRAGLGLTLAAIFAWNTDDDDFVGAYDPGRAQIEGLKNSVENSVKIGGTWVSVDWFGPLSVPFTAMMYAKKYGKNGAPESLFQFAKGAAWDRGALQLPVLSDIGEMYKEGTQKKDQTLDEMVAASGNYIVNQASSRLIPSIFSDIAKMADPLVRKTSNSVEAVQGKIPGARNALPVKRNVFGEEVKAENPLYSLLFGARVKAGNDDAVIAEVDRITKLGDKNITFTDWAKSSGLQLAQFKNKVGDEKYKKATVEYGQELKRLIASTIATTDYKRQPVEKQIMIISNLDTKAQDKIFNRYGFVYKPAKKK